MRKWIFAVSVLLALNFIMNFYTVVYDTVQSADPTSIWFYLFLGLANLVAFVYAMVKGVEA